MANGGWGPRLRAQAVAVIVSCVLSASWAPAAFAAETPSPTPSVTTAPTPTPDPTAESTPTAAPSAATTPAPSGESATTPSATPTESASPTLTPSTPTPATVPPIQNPTSHATALAGPTVHPWFQAKYAELGGASGPLGKPIRNMECQAASCWQEFEGGVLTSDGTQIVKLSTAYVATWLAWGGPDGDLGIVAGPESCFGTYCQTPFRGGVIVWVPGSGVFPVAKAWFYDAWMQRGGATGSLGLPTDGMKCQSTACYQVFQKGTLTSSTSGIVALSSAYVATWLANGGPDGILGLITGPETCNGKTCTVPFQNGSLVWTPGVGVSVTNLRFSSAPTPQISGTAETGKTLTTFEGTWSPTPDSFSYQWKRGGSAIAGATAKNYTVRAADVGTVLTVTVTARKDGYRDTSRTSAGVTAAIASFSSSPTPTFTGPAQVGGTLVGAVGTWSPKPDTLTYQWTRDDAPIPGATSTSYLLTSADRGAKVRFTVTGAKSGFTTVTRVSTGRTVLAVFTATPTPTVSGTAAAGATLTASTGTWSPTPDSFTYQWKRNGVTISGATAKTYTVSSADAGAKLSVSVTGLKTGYASVTTTSAEISVPAAPVVRITGNITTDTTWVPTVPTVYLITKPITVTSGATLTVGDRAIVKFSDDAALTVAGSLVAQGSAAVPIPFTSVHDDSVGGDTDGTTTAPGRDWDGINVTSGGTITLDRARVSYGLWAMTANEAASVTVTSSTLDGRLDSSSTRGAVVMADNTVSRDSIYVSRPDGATYTSGVRITGNTVSAGGLNVSSLNTSTTAVPVVVTGNTLSGSPATSGLLITDAQLRPSNVTDNTTQSGRILWRGTLVEDWTLRPTDQDVLQGNFTVAAGATLTAPAGTTQEFGEEEGLTIEGSLVALGTASALVSFTEYSSELSTGWSGITVAAGGSVSLEHTRMWGGLRGDQAVSMRVTSSDVWGISSKNAKGPVTIADNKLRGLSVERPEGAAFAFPVTVTGNTSSSAMRISSLSTTAPQLAVTDNQITGDDFSITLQVTDVRLRPSTLTGNTVVGGKAGFFGYGGTLVENWTLPSSGPQVVFDSLTVPSGKTLTAPAGTVVKNLRDAQMTVGGSLVVQGTTASPVTFTSLYDDSVGTVFERSFNIPPDQYKWKGIELVDSGSVTGTNLVVKYATGGISGLG